MQLKIFSFLFVLQLSLFALLLNQFVDVVFFESTKVGMSGIVFSPLFACDRFFFAGFGNVASIVIPEVGHAVSIITNLLYH